MSGIPDPFVPGGRVRRVRIEVWVTDDQIDQAKAIAASRNAECPDDPDPWTWRSWISVKARQAINEAVETQHKKIATRARHTAASTSPSPASTTA